MGGGASKYAAPGASAGSDKTSFLLRERVKEMRCMYGLSNLIAVRRSEG